MTSWRSAVRVSYIPNHLINGSFPLSDSLASLNQTAAILMVVAVTELFPGALFEGGQGTADRFFYDFSFPFEFQPGFLSLIEERMRLILREKRAIRKLEMMPSNAASMMEHRGQPLAANLLLEMHKAVVEMCQIGDFAAYTDSAILEELTIPHFKILEAFPFTVFGKKRIRIVGAASLDKEKLKQIAKLPSVSSRSHLHLLEETKMLCPLSEEGFWMWCPKGEALKNRLLDLGKQLLETQKFSFISSPLALVAEGDLRALAKIHLNYFLQSGIQRIAEVALVSSSDYTDSSLGLFSTKAFFADRAHLFCPDEKLLDECISFLQFILKIPKILGFEFEIVLLVSSEGSQKTRARAVDLLRGALDRARVEYTVCKDQKVGLLASIDVQIADALGRRWTGPCLSIPDLAMPVGKGSVLSFSLFGSLERMVALLLEQKGGWLPLSLAPEQIRILAVTSSIKSYAKQVQAALQSEGFRVTIESREGLLKKKLYLAIEDRVPYVILLGEKEHLAKTLTVRAYGESQELSLSLDEFGRRVKSEMRSATSELTN